MDTRCFWAVTMFLNVGVACMLGLLLYLRFYEMPTRITIENQFEPIQNLPYPAITICSPNHITNSALDRFKKSLVSGNVTTDIKRLVPHILGSVTILNKLKLSELKQLQNIIESNRYKALDVLSLLPQRCDQFLKRCFFEQKVYPCKELFYPIITKSGMCCVFNSIYKLKKGNNGVYRNERQTNFSKHKVTKVGLSHGLNVVMDYDPCNAMDSSIVYAGATKVMLTDWREFPANEEASFIKSGTEAFHVLSNTFTYCSDEVQQLPLSSRKCYFKDELTLPYFKDYHNSDCELSCLIKEVENQCQCTPLYVPYVSTHAACNFTSLDCIMAVQLANMNRLNENGRCNCLRDCISHSYTSKVIIGNLKSVEHLMDNRYSGIVFNGSTTIMHFYFPAPFYVKQKQETVISLISLMSNLGGVFGLCLGCSFISLIEIWFYIYVALKKYVKGHLKKRRHQRE
ncbi:unnamed protein product, partial [Iphiclides podalirius]